MMTRVYRYLVGEVYVEMDGTAADERLSKEKDSIEERIQNIDQELVDIKQQMARLKVSLYSKFKNSINLDE
jgi:chaperonin cofactor prefoldin